MTSPDKILVTLLNAAHTTGALADTMRLPELVIEAMAKRHVKDGLVDVERVANVVDVWTLTDTGREAANALKPAVAR